MKRAYLANGTLVANVESWDAAIQVDSTTWTYINTLLGTDHCYLIIGKTEIVKVQSVETPNLLLVVRGLEETCYRSWPSNTPISYGLTQSEINDAVAFVGYTITPVYPIALVNGIVSYPELVLNALGGVTIGGDNEGGWTIQNITGPVGCYNPLNPSQPPPIPLTYFNLRTVTEGYYRTSSDGSYRAYQ